MGNSEVNYTNYYRLHRTNNNSATAQNIVRVFGVISALDESTVAEIKVILDDISEGDVARAISQLYTATNSPITGKKVSNRLVELRCKEGAELPEILYYAKPSTTRQGSNNLIKRIQECDSLKTLVEASIALKKRRLELQSLPTNQGENNESTPR